MSVIGVRRNKTGKGFSTERYCGTCGQTMHWTKFHAELKMCAQCHRESLREHDEPVIRNVIVEVIEFIEKVNKN